METTNVGQTKFIQRINRKVNVKTLKPKSNFHKQVLNAQRQIHIQQPERVMEILNQYITQNQYIQINNNYIDIKEEFQK